MITEHNILSLLVFLGVFAATAGVGGLFLAGLYGGHRRAAARLRDLSPTGPSKAQPGKVVRALPRIGLLILPTNAEQLTFLKNRLTRAGIYGPNAVKIFLGIKLLLLAVLPLTAGVVPFATG